jgi:hypothetical protein
MALVPFRNHWWHVTLLPATHGLTTDRCPTATARSRCASTSSPTSWSSRPATVSSASFSWATAPPVPTSTTTRSPPCGTSASTSRSIPGRSTSVDSPAFPDDTLHDSYDADAVARFWRILAGGERVLARFASRFNGKTSPTQVFWHSFDLAHARYSGRPATVPAGAIA